MCTFLWFTLRSHQQLDYITFNGKMINERRIEKRLEGAAEFEVLS
jgi:hypothetical protein